MKQTLLVFILSLVPFLQRIRAQEPPLKADLIDLVFTENGTVINRANPELPVITGSEKPEITYAPRYGSYAAYFNGSSHCYYQIDYSRNTGFKQAVCNGFTMEIVCTNDPGGTQSSFSTQQYGGFGFEQQGTALSFYAYINGTYAQVDAVTPIETGQVYHTVAVYDKQQGQLSLYINGHLESQTTVSGELGLPTAAISQWIAIGGDTSAGNDFVQAPFRGAIYKARLFSEPLSGEDVATLYNAIDHTAAIAPGLYRVSNGKTGRILRDNLLVEDGKHQKLIPQCTTDGDIELSQIWEVEATDEKGAYLLTNVATGNRLRSITPARLDEEGAKTRFYAYDNGMYAIECGGYLADDGTSIVDRGGDGNSASAWRMEPADVSQLDTYAAGTLEALRSWYKPGNRFDEYPHSTTLENILQEQPDADACRRAARAIYVPVQKKLRVLQYNTWNNGRMVANGAQAIIETIEQTQPDVLLLQEVRSQEFVDDVLAYFQQKGITYYGKSMNISTAVISRYPFESIRSSNELGAGSYAFAKARIRIGDKTLALYSVHLDWLYLGYYYPRGFEGNSNSTPYAKITPYDNADDVLAINNKSRRPDEVKALIADATLEREADNWVIMGGDFNEPSYLDWQEDTRNIRNHNNLVINWPCSYMLAEAGLRDAYRTCYPDPVTHPGFTCNAGNKWVDPSEYTWAYGVDDRDRIDQTYYAPAPGMALTRATIIGPKEDYYDRAIRYEKTSDPILTPNCVWASDHKAVLTEYMLSVNVPAPLNQTEVDEGCYYLTTSEASAETTTFVGCSDEGTLTYFAGQSGEIPQTWNVRATGIGQNTNNGFLFLNGNGTLTNATCGAQAYTLTGQTDRTAIVFDRQSDFSGRYLQADEQPTVSNLITPSETNETDLFCFRMRPAAQGITRGGIYSDVIFSDSESAGYPAFKATQVAWLAHLEPDTWKAVSLPSAPQQIISLETGQELQPGTDITLLQYDTATGTFGLVETPNKGSGLIAAGNYLMSCSQGGWIEFRFGETIFGATVDTPTGFTGTGTATSRTVRGFTLNEKGTRLVFHESVEVGPFEAYMAVDEGETPQTDIILSRPTGLHAIDAHPFNISVHNRRIVVEGAAKYRIFNTAGQQVSNHQPLPPGIYTVTAGSANRTRKVVVE